MLRRLENLVCYAMRFASKNVLRLWAPKNPSIVHRLWLRPQLKEILAFLLQSSGSFEPAVEKSSMVVHNAGLPEGMVQDAPYRKRRFSRRALMKTSILT